MWSRKSMTFEFSQISKPGKLKLKKAAFIQLLCLFCSVLSKKKNKKLVHKITLSICATSALSCKSVTHNLYRIICALSQLNSTTECS